VCPRHRSYLLPSVGLRQISARTGGPGWCRGRSRHAARNGHVERQAQRVPLAVLVERAALQGDGEGCTVCRRDEAAVVAIVLQADAFDGQDVVHVGTHARCMPLVGIHAVAEHVYLEVAGIASKHGGPGQRGGIDGDRGQTGAALEGISADVRHAGRDFDAGQSCTAREGLTADGRHVVRNDGILVSLNQRVRFSLDKGVTVVAAVVLRISRLHRDIIQTRAAPEDVNTDARHAGRDVDAGQTGAGTKGK